MAPPLTTQEERPTRDEIRAECWKIQAEWSEAERWRRAGCPNGRPPETVIPGGHDGLGLRMGSTE